MFTFTIVDNTKKLYTKWAKKMIEKICAQTEKVLKIKNDQIFDISIVNSKTIKAINKQYRSKDKVTDVISFALNDNTSLATPLIGEIFICYEQTVKQAKTLKHSFEREFCFLTVHGLLHLLGYDHMKKSQETKMLQTTNKILKLINL